MGIFVSISTCGLQVLLHDFHDLVSISQVLFKNSLQFEAFVSAVGPIACVSQVEVIRLLQQKQVKA